MFQNKRFYVILLAFLFIIGCVSMDNSNITNKSNLNCNGNIVISVIGKGAPPTKKNLSEVQKYLFAERAAIMDGYRQLSEKLGGVIITSSTHSSDYAVKSDSVDAVTKILLKGAKIIKIKHNINGVCEVNMKIEFPKKVLQKYMAEPIRSNIACLEGTN